MSGVKILAVGAEDAELRLDRWFRRHFPGVAHGRLEKLLRTGQIRIDGKRAHAGDRLTAGQSVRIPPLGEAPPQTERPAPPPSERDAAALRQAVLYRDPEMLIINKPPGLAVQGGTGTIRHLDALLEALRFEAEEAPRLVHRLDKDTSGVLVLARNAGAAAKLAAAFRGKAASKVYWAAVIGVPEPRQGRIDLPLAKIGGSGFERVEPEDDGKPAVTYYTVVEHAGKKLAFVALMPATGRTHQLRAHCKAIGTPILGDAKYGGIAGGESGLPSTRKLHLHARSIAIPHPGGGIVEATAPLPPHMVETWRFFGFPEKIPDPFAALRR
jgi:23S rRNA pseudouridine955/2504/2580 synthase